MLAKPTKNSSKWWASGLPRTNSYTSRLSSTGSSTALKRSSVCSAGRIPERWSSKFNLLLIGDLRGGPVGVDLEFFGVPDTTVEIDGRFMDAHLIGCLLERAGELVGVVFGEPVGIDQGWAVFGVNDDPPRVLVVVGVFCGGLGDVAGCPTQIGGVAGAH